MRFLTFAAAVIASTLISGTSALAERMSGQEVASLLSKGRVEFQAGSVWQTQSAGRYVFTHGSRGEEGTYKLFSNGEVHILDEKTGDTIKFYFDKDEAGVPALIYLQGASKGRRFPIKQ